MRKNLPEVCHLQYGYPFDSSLFSETEGMPVIRIRDVVRGYSETKTVEPCGEEYLVKDGDILIGMDGEFNIAKWKGGPALLNQRVCKLIPFDVDPDYIFYLLPKILKAIEAKTSFATVKHLSAKELKAISIELPERVRQQQISWILNKICSLIEKRKRQLSKLDQLVKARFVEMFGNSSQNKAPSSIYFSPFHV
jgi:type I restriction enzyme S subunit